MSTINWHDQLLFFRSYGESQTEMLHCAAQKAAYYRLLKPANTVEQQRCNSQ
uniref:Uncharacterized protein n=1 Tax=Rheinheimera sp. BAL341 TaxID=1708203 RepID=A0A486XYK5_9GAMM